MVDVPNEDLWKTAMQDVIRRVFAYIHLLTGICIVLAHILLLFFFAKFKFLKRKTNIYVFFQSSCTTGLSSLASGTSSDGRNSFVYDLACFHHHVNTFVLS